MNLQLSQIDTPTAEDISQRIGIHKPYFLVFYLDRQVNKTIYHPYRKNSEVKELMQSYLEDQTMRFYNFSVIPENFMEYEGDSTNREICIDDIDVRNLIEDAYSLQVRRFDIYKPNRS